MRKLLIIIALLFSYNIGFCQIEKNYCPVKITDTIPSDLQKLMRSKLEKEKAIINVTLTDKKKAKYKCELYDERVKEIVSDFNKDYYMIDTMFTPYLQSIADKIYSANPQLNKETRVYAYRSNVPNAFSFGEGTIGFNLGLLKRMENESQLAFILCHELAHHHLKHAEQAINKLTELNYDKALEKEIAKIKKEEYNKYSKLKELMESLTFDVTKHSRDKEHEADSVGLSYLINTNYDPYEALRCMEILEKCDEPVYTKNLELKNYFSFPGYAFKDSWLAYDTSDYVYAKERYSDSDTASTHPDCKKRYIAIKRQLEGVAKVKSNPTDEERFNNIVRLSEFESIATLYHYNQVGEALYESLILLEKYPDNIYLHSMVGRCLYKIHHYQTIKAFGLAVDMPDKRFPENYNRFLTFIHQLRLIELVKLDSEYLKARADKYSSDEEFLYTMILTSKISPFFNTADLTAEYKQKFPKGKYINKL